MQVCDFEVHNGASVFWERPYGLVFENSPCPHPRKQQWTSACVTPNRFLLLTLGPRPVWIPGIPTILVDFWHCFLQRAAE